MPESDDSVSPRILRLCDRRADREEYDGVMSEPVTIETRMADHICDSLLSIVEPLWETHREHLSKGFGGVFRESHDFGVLLTVLSGSGFFVLANEPPITGIEGQRFIDRLITLYREEEYVASFVGTNAMLLVHLGSNDCLEAEARRDRGEFGSVEMGIDLERRLHFNFGWLFMRAVAEHQKESDNSRFDFMYPVPVVPPKRFLDPDSYAIQFILHIGRHFFETCESWWKWWVAQD